jgi:hypothetical protein
MNCDSCRQQLQARLDGDAVCSDDVEAHLLHCPECRSLHRAADRLRIGLLAVPPAAPPIDLADRIVTSVLRDRRKRQLRRRVLFVGGALAAAAALIIVVFLPPSSSNQLANRVAPTVRNQSDSPPLSLNDKVDEATSVVASLARRTADETVSSGQMVVSSVQLPLPPQEKAPSDPPPPAGKGVATGLELVTNTAHEAFDRFLHDLSPMTSETKSGL